MTSDSSITLVVNWKGYGSIHFQFKIIYENMYCGTEEIHEKTQDSQCAQDNSN
jgi:hypothetical protein